MNIKLSRSRRDQSNPSPSPFLPDDLIVEILSFLKVKPLMKMKCVSKSWNTLISDPKLVKIHLNRSSQNSHSYLVSYENSEQLVDICFVPFSINDLLENGSINLPNGRYNSVIDKDCCEVVGSYNGLVCLHGLFEGDNKVMPAKWLRIWNPATRTISDKLPCQLYFSTCMFGYDNSTDTYKVLALPLRYYMATTEVQVLSFGDNIWRKIQSFPAGLYFSGFVSVHLDCTLNWLGTINNGNVDNQFVIISFDLGTEIHTQLQPPLIPLKARLRAHQMTGVCVLMDSLCFYNDFNETDLVIWKMTKFGDDKSWTQFLKLNYHNLQLEFKCGLSSTYLYANGDILVFTKESQDHAILYNWRNRTRVKTGYNKHWYSINNYVESLVSTC